jgi:hypothetical protein
MLSPGINHDGVYFTTILMMGIAGGAGGLPDRDGDNVAGNMWCPKLDCGRRNSRNLYPILTLYRKELPDTGGIGKFRRNGRRLYALGCRELFNQLGRAMG